MCSEDDRRTIDHIMAQCRLVCEGISVSSKCSLCPHTSKWSSMLSINTCYVQRSAAIKGKPDAGSFGCSALNVEIGGSNAGDVTSCIEIITVSGGPWLMELRYTPLHGHVCVDF